MSTDPFLALVAADAAAILSGPGSVAVTLGAGAGAKLTRGFVDTQDVQEPDAEGYPVTTRRPVLRVPAGSLGTVKRDASLTAGGASYRVVSFDSDGDVDRIVLREV